MNVRLTIAALLLLTACGGSPWADDGTDGGSGIDEELPPGTTTPTPKSGITRYEAKTTTGNGYVTGVAYDSENDRLSVDGLAFDGDNIYRRGTRVGNLGSVAVYEGKPTVPDDFSGEPVTQITPHRALYGVSPDGTMNFAIVRTGGYVEYGFGGFIYQREGGVTLPRTGTDTGELRGQATYSGKYAGLRDFKNSAGLEYATGDMTLDIDFDDFNDGNGVKGRISNRAILDVNGNDITNDVIAALSEKSDTTQTRLPEIRFRVAPGVMNDNGEITGEVFSAYTNGDGALETYETGRYYALVGGENAQNVVGVVVVEADDPRTDNVTVRETGGFILERGDAATE